MSSANSATTSEFVISVNFLKRVLPNKTNPLSSSLILFVLNPPPLPPVPIFDKYPTSTADKVAVI